MHSTNTYWMSTVLIVTFSSDEVKGSTRLTRFCLSVQMKLHSSVHIFPKNHLPESLKMFYFIVFFKDIEY